MAIREQDEIMGEEQGRLAPDDDMCRCQERPEQVKSAGHEQRAVAAGGEGGGRVGEYEKWCCRLWGSMRALLCSLCT